MHVDVSSPAPTGSTTSLRGNDSGPWATSWRSTLNDVTPWLPVRWNFRPMVPVPEPSALDAFAAAAANLSAVLATVTEAEVRPAHPVCAVDGTRAAGACRHGSAAGRPAGTHPSRRRHAAARLHGDPGGGVGGAPTGPRGRARQSTVDTRQRGRGGDPLLLPAIDGSGTFVMSTVPWNCPGEDCVTVTRSWPYTERFVGSHGSLRPGVASTGRLPRWA